MERHNELMKAVRILYEAWCDVYEAPGNPAATVLWHAQQYVLKQATEALKS